ncbi:MAG: polysaccharide export protein [Verrucomicrobia bacterium]|nr:polysaccharide export protein [Verrucomicrobiota bacterium]MBR6798172.1 polysaccharide export protein [Opitutales bacterium]
MKSNVLIRAAMFLAALFFCLGFSACRTAQPHAGYPASNLSEDGPGTQDYRIRPLDTLRFEMYAEPDNRGEYRVSKEGNITLNFIGQVTVAGKTLSELKDSIEKRYRDEGFYTNPQVTLTVIAYAERRIYVSGFVASPGPVLIPIEEELTLGKAIDAARGVLPRGSRTSVKVTRSRDGVIQTWEVDLKAIQEGYEPDFPLEEGDRVYVPDSAI